MNNLFHICNKNSRELAAWLVFLIAIAGSCCWLLLDWQRLFQIGTGGVAYPLALVTAVIFLWGLFYFLLLALLAYFSIPVPALPEEKLPGCTVIVPAYNEGQHVKRTLLSILQCDYPAEKLEVIAVNDGSGDDTWFWIEQAAAESNGRIQTVNLAENGGKKHALYLGMKQTQREIIITVDSDSVLKKDTIRNLVAPFVSPQIGAVAGNICAENRSQTFFSTMLDVALVFGCEFLRAAQSATGSVFCTPGALSAYRSSAVKPLLDEWLHQTFLGLPARIGEDRAIATLLLRSGWKIIHQCNALAETRMPETYCGLCKMLIRWVRSDIRENIMMCKFVLERFRPGEWRSVLFGIHWFAMSSSCILPLFYIPLFLYVLFFGTEAPVSFLLLNFLGALLWSVMMAVIYARKRSCMESVWAFWYGVFLPFGIFWISIYALLTVRNSQWMTRTLPAGKIAGRHGARRHTP